MGVFGPGVGGGFLAAAGAVGGLGKGLADVGEAQQKMNLETKMSQLTQAREEAITRLQGQQQSGLEEQRAGHEKERVGEEIAGRSAVAHYETETKKEGAAKQREFAGQQATQHQASQEKIAAGHDVARVTAAKAHMPAGKTPPKEWGNATVNLQGSIGTGPDGKGVVVPGRSISVMVHNPSGQRFMQIGDQLMPYDASKPDGLLYDPKSIRRAPASATQDLLGDPLGFTPSGNSKREVFLNKFHYLPGNYIQSASKAQPGQPVSQGGGGIGDAETAPENEDPSESESDTPAPPAE